MFSKINLIGSFLLILPLTLATDTGNEKKQIFYNCNNYQEIDSFDLRVPGKCNVTENISWHLELKNVIRYHRNNRTCTKELKIVFVSKDHVLVPIQNSEGNNDFLLLDYLDGIYKHQPSCLSGDTKYHRFNYDIYIDVMRDNFWTNNITIHKAFEKSFLEFVVGNNYEHFSDEALFASIEAFLFAKCLNGKHTLKEYYGINEEPHSLIESIKGLFESEKSKKYLSYKNLEHYFYEITQFNLTNDEAIISQGSKIIKDKIQSMAKLNYKETCKLKNEKRKIFAENATPSQIIREYLDRKDILAEEIEVNELYLVHVCKQENPKEIHSDFKLDEICYEKMPVVLEDGSLMFADRKHYLYHYSSKRSCTSLFNIKSLIYAYHEAEMDVYDSVTNALMERVSFIFSRVSTGRFGHSLQKHKFYFIIGAVFIFVFGTTVLLVVSYFCLKSLGTDGIFEAVEYTFKILTSIVIYFLWILLRILTIFLPFLNKKAQTLEKTFSNLTKTKKNSQTSELSVLP
uniref:Pv-fam-d protein n=1 Tax=Strongyloides papillosus TaxID=174720 RepID=A0A0N5B5K5_STREA